MSDLRIFLRNRPSFIATCSTLVLLVLSIALMISLFLLPAHGQILRVDVWTNKGGLGFRNLDGGTYVFNETIYIYFALNLDADRVRLTIIFPDGSRRIVIDRPLSAGIYSDSRVIGGGPGTRIVILEVWAEEQYAYDEVRYTAVFCPSHGMYLGVDVKILSDEDVEITGWFRPVGINWRDFVDLCWNIHPGKERYISYLREDLLNPMFGINRAHILGSGLDEAVNKVWLKLRVKFRDLSYSDHELKILKFIDPIKRAGRGFVDEVRVVAFKEIWKVSPQPTNMLAQSVDWKNRDAASAPLNYEVYLHPLILIRVRVEGIPSHTSVSILINGVNIGNVSPGAYLEKTLISGEHVVQVQPDIIKYDDNIRYRCKNSVYHLISSGEVIFDYTLEYRVTISVKSPIGAGLTIDGNYYSFNQLPFEDWWENGSLHQVIADEEGDLVMVSDVERKVTKFRGWSDGTAARERVVRVSGPLNLTAIYDLITQYYVSVKSEYAEATGSGWHDEGKQISIGLRGYVSEDQGAIVYLSRHERMVFQGWSGDLTSSNIEENLIVNSPKFVEALWRKQYYVDVITDYSSAKGAGWHYDGETVRIALVDDVVYDSNKRTRHIFSHWSGDYTGSEREFSITVDRPLKIKALWITEHLVEIRTDPIEILSEAIEFRGGWITAGGLLRITIKDEIQLSEDVKYVFVRWIADGESSFSREIRKTVNKPLQIRIEYDPWYYIQARSEYGEVYGSGWYKKGSQAEIFVEPQVVGSLVKHVFSGWLLNGELISNSAVLRLAVDRPLVLTAKWETDYTGLILLTTIITLGFTVGGFNFIKLRGEPLSKIVLQFIRAKIIEFLNTFSSEKRLREKLKKLEELYQRGEIGEEAYVYIRHELEAELEKLMKENPPKR